MGAFQKPHGRLYCLPTEIERWMQKKLLRPKKEGIHGRLTVAVYSVLLKIYVLNLVIFLVCRLIHNEILKKLKFRLLKYIFVIQFNFIILNKYII